MSDDVDMTDAEVQWAKQQAFLNSRNDFADQDKAADAARRDAAYQAMMLGSPAVGNPGDADYQPTVGAGGPPVAPSLIPQVAPDPQEMRAVQASIDAIHGIRSIVPSIDTIHGAPWPPPSWTAQADTHVQRPVFQGDASVVEPTIQRDDLVGGAADPYLTAMQSGQPLTPAEESQIQIDQPDAADVPATTLPNGVRIVAHPGDVAPDQQSDAYRQFVTPPTIDQQLDHEIKGSALPAPMADVTAMSPTEQAKVYAAATPEQRTAIKTMHDMAAQHQAAADELEATRQNQLAAQQNYQDQQKAIAKASSDTQDLMARATALANTKIDPNRYTKNQSGLSRIGDIIASAIGGAVMKQTGGRNLALDALDSNINQDIEAQKSDLANRWQGINAQKSAIQSEYEHHGDLYKAAETYRAATYQSAISALQTKLQDYDPAGTTAMRIADNITDLHTRQAQSLMAYKQQVFKNELEAGKDSRETGLNTSTIQKNAADIAKTRAETLKIVGGIGGAPVVSPDDVPHPSAYYEGMGLSPTPGGVPMSPKAYDKLTSMRQKGAEASKAESEATATANAQTVNDPHTGKALVGDVGKPIQLPVTEATAANKELTSQQQAVDALSDVRRALAAGPDTFDRSKWAGIQARIGSALPRMAEMYGAKFSSREEQALKDITQLDFDSYYSRVANKGKGLASIDAILSGVKLDNETMLKGALKYKGGSTIFDTSKPPAAVEDDIDQIGKTLEKSLPGEDESPEGSPYERAQALSAHIKASAALGMSPQHDIGITKLQGVLNGDVTQHSGSWFITDSEGKDIAGPFDDAKKANSFNDKAKSKALGVLRKASTSAPLEGIQDRAARIVNDYDLAHSDKGSK